MKGSEIRKKFIDFFAEREHRVVPSSSLVPSDPTLLLTNAGMVQFKPYFLGEENPPFRRATTAQKCLRTTDIESVGLTARHNTFFEMLGNFSFGDYYKEKAIPWAWELVTGVLEIGGDQLWISVFEDDLEAEEIWKNTPGVKPERIIRLGAEDNFWDMGPTGPCGPCSEILYDRGEQFSCSESCAPGCDCDRFLELWNLVFMQYNRNPDQSLEPLPRKNIDTGLGLERAAAIKQGVDTIFETDLLKPIMQSIGSYCGVELGRSPDSDISLKVVADHSRAATFLVSDGVIPSNEGRGYILRRLLRRAIMHGRKLGIEEFFLQKLSDVVVETMGSVYADLKEHRRLISGVLTAEEEKFGQTLEQGIELLSEVIDDHRSSGKRTIEGETVFYLHDTLGFPLEVTEEIARENSMDVDTERFDLLMEEQRERARQSAAQAFEKKQSLNVPTEFTGYGRLRQEASIVALLRDGEPVREVEGDLDLEIVLDATPFYAEAGGQVGDAGTIESESGRVAVRDTYYNESGTILHRGRLEGLLKVGQRASASVDGERRRAIARNHTATHVLHWALRQVLGTHAKQSGSMVTPERLRFDFTHFKPLTPKEIDDIERLANQKVLEDASVSTVETTQEDARERGAIALFGEKYGEDVRMVCVGPFSKELCGGIHVERTGQVGPIRIASESGIGTGMRRIEATSGLATISHYKHLEQLTSQTSELLKVEREQVPQRLSELLNRVRHLEKEAAREASKAAVEKARESASRGRKTVVAGLEVLLCKVEGESQKTLRDLADILMNEGEYSVVALAGGSEGKAQLVVKLDERAVERGLNARELANAGGGILGGGGGGREDMAVAGGSRTDMLDESLDEVLRLAKEELGD